MDFSVVSPDEVRGKYERAHDKRYMLEALAGLTDSTEEEVAEFLGLEPESEKRSLIFDEKRALKLYNVGMSDVQVARELNVSSSTIWRWRTELNLPANGTVSADRLALYNQGLSDVEIAKREGVSPSAICLWRRYYGLKSNRGRSSV